MGGLEATETNFSELERTWRIDSEFFQQRHVRLAADLAKLQSNVATEVAKISDGNHFSIADEFVEDGIPYYRGQDVVGHFFIEQSTQNCITREAFEQPFMKRSHLHQGDVLLSIIGTVGETSLVKTDREATCSCKLAILRPHSIASAYLAVYLSSSVGRSLSERWKRGAVQTGLLLEDMDQLPIARFSDAFEGVIVDIVDRAYASREISRNLMQQAEKILLQSLGLETWTPPEALSYVRSSREVLSAMRLDAEHFQPRFKSLSDLIEATGDGVRLGDLLCENQRGKQPDYADGGLPVVNSKHVLRNTVTLDVDNRSAVIDADGALIKKGDVLMNGTGVGTIGRSAAYLHDAPAIPDNHVTILRPKKELDPIYLAVFLNSKAGQFQVEQRLRGSSGQIELYPGDIAEFRIWLAPSKLQQSIRKQVEQSFAHKQEAIRLLDAAKRAVEIAIEDSESAALAFLGSAT